MVLRGSIYSNTLNMETGITVITPNDYGQAKIYKVCFVFHGICGGNADYSNYTMLPYYAYDKDTIYICPEVARSFYRNIPGGARFFDYVAVELPAAAKQYFNISGKREDTTVAGGSMGGYGALKCALTYPETFGKCIALAPCMTDTESFFKWDKRFENLPMPDFTSAFGEKLEYDENDNPTALAKRRAENQLKSEFYIACGNGDGFAPDCRKFAENLRAFGYRAEYEEPEGIHDMYFFNQSLLDGLTFFGGKKND